MRLVTLVALSILVALPADAMQHRRQHASLATACDNDGRCTTLDATAAVPSEIGPEIKTTTSVTQHPPRVFDANGNIAAGIVMSRKTGARARVGVAYAARFQAYIDDLETNHGARVLFMGGFGPGDVRHRANTPAEKRWMCASSGAAWWMDVAIYPVASPSVGSPLRMDFLRVDGGAIRTTATPRSM
jgi:hypothetical protein